MSVLPEFSEKEDNLERYTTIFETLLSKISVLFDFPPGTRVEWIAPLTCPVLYLFFNLFSEYIILIPRTDLSFRVIHNLISFRPSACVGGMSGIYSLCLIAIGCGPTTSITPV